MGNIVKRIVRKWIPILITTLTGAIILVGYLNPTPTMVYYRDRLIEWGVIVAAFAFILGLFNVLRVHGRRVVDMQQEWPYSLILMIAALVAWVPPFLRGPWLNLQPSTLTRQMLNYVILPVGATLTALLVFTLTAAAFRLLRVRRSIGALFFILIVIIALLGSTPIPGWEWLSDVRAWMINVPGLAGMRGLLLGVALGIVITALRVIFFSDRPQSEF